MHKYKALFFIITLIAAIGCTKVDMPTLKTGHKIAYHLVGQGIAKVEYVDAEGVIHTETISGLFDWHIALDVEIGTKFTATVTAISSQFMAERKFSQDGIFFQSTNFTLYAGNSFVTSYTVKELP